MVGEDVSEEVELGNRECPRRENVGVVGEGKSDSVDEREGWCAWPDKVGDAGLMSPS